jgi:hypothetical protein
LGQRIIVGTQLTLSPNLNSFIAGNASLRLFTSPGLTAEGVLSRRFSLTVEGSRYGPEATYDWQGRQGQLQLRGEQVRLGLRMYNFLRRGNLAPVGPYQEVSFFGLHHRLFDLSEQLGGISDEWDRGYYDLGIGVALGTHWIVGPRWVIDFGLRADWPFDLFRNGMSPLGTYFTELGTQRLRRLMGLRFYVGLGILLPGGRD